MLAQIAVMIGIYVIMRSASLLLRGGERSEHFIVRVLAALVIVGTVVILITMLIRGVSGLEP